MNKWLISSLIPALVACHSEPDNNKAGQVLAKVNGDEITVHQLQAEMHQLQVAEANQKEIAPQMLNSLIDRQLLLQEAIKLNLDRTPEVLQLVNSARAQIYAQAYLARKMASMSAANKKDIEYFIATHDELFKHRKLLTATTFIFNNDISKVNYTELQTLVTNAEELKNWLNEHQIKYQTINEQLTTETMPKQMQEALASIKPDDLLFLHDKNRIVVRSVNQLVDASLPEEQAVAIASKAVNENNRQQFMVEEIQRLKKLADIELRPSNLMSKESSKNIKPNNSNLD